jgi:MerR family transcriptional regulator, copper efflux regulator
LSVRLTISEAARRLGTTPRMLRYREGLGLVAPVRRGGWRGFGDPELAAAGYAATLESRYGVSPKALSFALRVLAEPQVEADVRRLGALAHRLEPARIDALEFEAAKARRLLGEVSGSSRPRA